jgi:hypothetical protein
MSSNADWAPRPTEKYPPMRIDHEVTLTQAMPIKAYDYWRARRANRIMPSRADISPRDMREFLAYAGLIEARKSADGTTDYLVRLAGTGAEEVLGPISGKMFHEFLPPEIETRWRQVCDEVYQSRGPVSVFTRMAMEDKNWLRTETFVGPLSDGGEEITMFLLGFAAWPDFDDSP